MAVRTLGGMEGDELYEEPNEGLPDRGRGAEVWQRLSAYAYLSAP